MVQVQHHDCQFDADAGYDCFHAIFLEMYKELDDVESCLAGDGLGMVLMIDDVDSFLAGDGLEMYKELDGVV